MQFCHTFVRKYIAVRLGYIKLFIIIDDYGGYISRRSEYFKSVLLYYLLFMPMCLLLCSGCYSVWCFVLGVLLCLLLCARGATLPKFLISLVFLEEFLLIQIKQPSALLNFYKSIFRKKSIDKIRIFLQKELKGKQLLFIAIISRDIGSI